MFLPLSAWIKATHPLPKRFVLDDFHDHFNENWVCWVVLEEVSELYNVNQLNWVSLKSSREETKKYIKKSLEVIGSLDEDRRIDREEGCWIKHELGAPPHPCLPIYIICSGSDSI